ncbi:MAG: efflux transporter outer membrane subunit [Yersiniaceae bacterium]|nr:efflux transporter outer membrane subunit [Yersiniaceae bacterium]
MRGKYLTLLPLALLLAACGGSRVDPAPPTLLIPPQWRAPLAPSAASGHDWWQGFGDPQLNRLVDQALRYNNDILQARARVDEYQARVRAAIGDQLPTLDAGVNAARQRTLSSVTGQQARSTVYQGTLQLNYDVDLWGGQRSATEAARAGLEAQRAAADAAMLQVASSVASGYLTLRGLDAQLALTQATLTSRENSLQLAKRQYKTGYSSRLEWVQAESEYRATRAQIPQLQHQITQQENALNLLLGANPGPVARGTAFDHLDAPPLPSRLPSTLLNRRPDIVQAERLLVAADATLAVSRANLLPSLNLTAGGTLQEDTLEAVLAHPFRLWSLGGSVLAPIINREALNAQVDISMAARNQALYQYEYVVRNAFVQVNDSIDAITRLGEQLSEAEQQQQALGEALRIAHNRYANGYASYLEELDAQRALYSTQLTVIQLKTNLLLAQIDLWHGLGGGWERGAGNDA